MTREEYNLNPNLCENCGQPILCPEGKTLSDIKRKRFCNHSCASTFTNKLRAKKPYYCNDCGKIIGYGYEQFHRRKYCNECNPNHVNWNEITYGEAKEKRSYQVNSRIRELARTIYLKNHPDLKCEICGYNKHVEIHHIRGISTFPDDTPVAEINNLNNLIGLCPNHHWEVENGLIQL